MAEGLFNCRDLSKLPKWTAGSQVHIQGFKKPDTIWDLGAS
jgi:hypothetical protein